MFIIKVVWFLYEQSEEWINILFYFGHINRLYEFHSCAPNNIGCINFHELEQLLLLLLKWIFTDDIALAWATVRLIATRTIIFVIFTISLVSISFLITRWFPIITASFLVCIVIVAINLIDKDLESELITDYIRAFLFKNDLEEVRLSSILIFINYELKRFIAIEMLKERWE